MTQVLDDTAAQQLNDGFRGEVLRPGDASYDDAKHAFNGMFNDRSPTVIARCTGVADVMAAIEFARGNDLEIAVRGGGHSVAGHSICDGGMLIDVSPMKGIRIDPQAKTAVAQAGLTWGEFDRETQAFGLATTGGRVTTTGIAGLTLGSGSGWLERKFGLVIDNLLSVDVVCADGRFVTASAVENEDLFWGLRGAGGNFGVATSFTYQLHDLGPLVMGGMLLHRRANAVELFRGWRDVMAAAPDELCGAFGMLTAPPMPFVPEDLQLQPAVAMIVLYAGPVEEADEAVAALKAIAPADVDLVAPMPYTFLQSLIDAANPPGRHQYWKTEHLPEISDAAIETLVEHANRIASPFSLVLVEPKGGAIARAAENDTSLGRRDVAATFYGLSTWEDPSESDQHIGWARDLGAAMEPHSTTGAALNFQMDEGENRVRSTFGEEKYARLVALKQKYDPDNVFHMNQNIKP
jgi:FAD/FMN-containing dehydrogenase